MRLLFVVAFLQVFSLQNSFALFDEDQGNNIPHNQALTPSTPLKSPPKEWIFSPLTTPTPFTPLRSSSKKGIFSPLTIPSPSTPFQSLTQESIFSPLTTPLPSTPLPNTPKKSILSPLSALEGILDKIRDELALLATKHDSVSPGTIGRVWEDIAPELVEKICDPRILDPNTSIERTSQGLNPDTYDGQPTHIHHVAKTPRRKALITKDQHQGKDRDILTKKNLITGEATIVAKRLSKQRAEEIKKELEAQALDNGENVEFRRIGNALHPKTGPSRINRSEFRIEKRTILKDLSEKLTLLQLGSS